MKRVIFAICGLLLSAQAHAQTPIFNWSGFYFGGNIGRVSQDIGGNYADFPSLNHSVNFDSLIGGAHAGFLVQNGNWVAGLETAYSGFSRKTGESFSISNDCNALADRTCENTISDLFTAGVRLGSVSGPWMIFVAGGYVTGKIKTLARITSTGALTSRGPFERHHGWYVGAGADFMFSPSWVGGIEYQYIDLNEKTHIAGTVNARNLGATSHIVRARLSYLFNVPMGR